GQELTDVQPSFEAIFANHRSEKLDAAGLGRLRDRLQDPCTGMNVVQEFMDSFRLEAEALLDPDINNAVAAVDAFEKNRRRYLVAKRLLDIGVELDFYGMGWDGFKSYP